MRYSTFTRFVKSNTFVVLRAQHSLKIVLRGTHLPNKNVHTTSGQAHYLNLAIRLKKMFCAKCLFANIKERMYNLSLTFYIGHNLPK